MTLPPPPRIKPLTLFAVPLVFMVLYDLTATRAFSYDSITCAMAIERGPLSFVFNAAHLLHSVSGWIVFNMLAAIGHPVRALEVLQSINVPIAGIAIGFFFWILGREFGIWRGLLGAALLGFSQAFWGEAVDPGGYAWATLASCVLVYLLVDETERSPFVLGLYHGLAALFHQLLILVVPAMLVKRGRRGAAAYLSGFVLTVGATYALILGIFHEHSFREMVSWAVGPAGWPTDRGPAVFHWWNFSGFLNGTALWRGLVYSIVAPLPERYAVFSLVVGAFGLVIFFALIGGSWRYFRRHSVRHDTVAALWVWIILLQLFFAVYSPGLIRFRLLCLPALIYLGLYLERLYPVRRMPLVLGCGVALMAMINYKTVIQPQSRLENNPSLTRTIWLTQQLHPGDVFLFAGGAPDSIINIYLPYFAPDIRGRSLKGYFFAHPQGDLAEIGRMIAEARRSHGRVLIEKALFAPETRHQLEVEGQIPEGTLDHWMASLGLRRKLIEMNGTYGMYEVS